jgi:hypothetical protein
MGVLIWTSELLELNIEAQRFLNRFGLNLFLGRVTAAQARRPWDMTDAVSSGRCSANVAACGGRVLLLLGTLYVGAALNGHAPKRRRAITCERWDECWRKSPGLSMFRWVFRSGTGSAERPGTCSVSALPGLA